MSSAWKPKARPADQSHSVSDAWRNYATFACRLGKRVPRRERKASCRRSHPPHPRSPRIADWAERIREVRDDEAPAGPEELENVVADLAVVRIPSEPGAGEGDE